jgi:hypothetical protein
LNAICTATKANGDPFTLPATGQLGVCWAHDERYAAALSRAAAADIFALADYARRARRAEEAGEPIPIPTPEEAEAARRFEALREEAMRNGWGESAYRAY